MQSRSPLLAATEPILEQFRHIITAVNVMSDRHEARLSELKIRCVLIDASVLVYADTILPRLEKRKYAFQWMNADGSLRVRWDNAPHHPHITTYPHHKRVGDEASIEASEEMSLDAVLRTIEELLQ